MSDPTPPPTRPPASVAFLLMALGRLVRVEVDEGLRAHGLSMRHLSALGHLAGDPGLSYSELARRAGVTAQSMQATLRQLEQRDAVTRQTEPGRGRTARLHLTETGSALLAAGRQTVADADRRLLADLPVARRTQLADTLLAVFTSARSA